MRFTRQEADEQRITDRWHDLSREINYMLMASPVNKLALLDLLLGRTPPEPIRRPLTLAIDFLMLGYGEDRRKLGPPAVLHPLRTAAILAQSMPELRVLDLLGAFLHDRDEDLDRDHVDPERWDALQAQLDEMLSCIDSEVQWFLGERIAILSRRPRQSYFDYINGIIAHATTMPDLVRIKLADKLDSTYDIQVPTSSFERVDFHKAMFDILFLPTFSGVSSPAGYYLLGEREAVLLLSSLAKNLLFVSLLRHTGLDRTDPVTRRLFDALAIASVRQARWVLLEVFATTLSEAGKQRALLEEVAEYVKGGSIRVVTDSSRGHQLDGTVLEWFLLDDDAHRKQRLRELYHDSRKFALVILSMIVIFYAFLDDEGFVIEGIEPSGITAVS